MLGSQTATDTMNPDGSVKRVITLTKPNGDTTVVTTTISASDYIKAQQTLESQISTLQSQLAATEPIATQVQAAISAPSLAATSAATTNVASLATPNAT
jgi:hypothetical protein